MKAFEYQPTGVLALDKLIQRIREQFGLLYKAVTNDRIVSVTFPLAATDVQVRHGLSGPPTAWEVVGIDGDANVWRSDSPNERPLEMVLLQASAPVTALIRFS